jgi:outer membrane biosynthesis protein TonB
MFPPIARTAHITGLVNASFLVDASGNVISITILSGPKILADETEKNTRTWKFASLGPASHAPWKDHTSFVYAYGDDPWRR